ncbi:MAG TPA: TIGR02450 family Trp-rich protein [Trichocoleus sp.]
MAKKQKFPHLLGSKWTAQHPVDGWRHFEVINRKNEGSWVFAELVSSCDPGVRFWINATLLKNRRLWQAGWQPLSTFKREETLPSQAVSQPSSES